MKSTIKSLNNFHPKHVSQRYCIKQTKTNAQDRIHNKEKKTSRELMSTPRASSL